MKLEYTPDQELTVISLMVELLDILFPAHKNTGGVSAKAGCLCVHLYVILHFSPEWPGCTECQNNTDNQKCA